MGIYLNPGNDAFASILKKDIYIDKSGLISYTNRVLNSSRMLQKVLIQIPFFKI